jgi:hypothetical protein
VLSWSHRWLVKWRSFEASEGEIQTFIERLTSIGLFEWKEQYVCPSVLDGVGWRVQIRWDGRRVDALGSNKFPSGFDEMQKVVEAFVHAPFAVPVEECNE